MRMRFIGISVALVALSVSLSGQAATPPARTPDGQPDVQGAWRPVAGGTQSLDPLMSSAADFEQRVTGVIKHPPSAIVDPPDGHIPYQPWALALQKKEAAAYEN